MSFRVYIVIELPIIDKQVELVIPADRRIYEIINALKKTIPELSNNYPNEMPCMYNKSTGKLYDLNEIIEDSNIKQGTRLIMI